MSKKAKDVLPNLNRKEEVEEIRYLRLLEDDPNWLAGSKKLHKVRRTTIQNSRMNKWIKPAGRMEIRSPLSRLHWTWNRIGRWYATSNHLENCLDWAPNYVYKARKRKLPKTDLRKKLK